MTDQPNLPSETDSFPFCDPYLCDGRDDKIVRTEELEKQLSTLIEGSRIAHIIIELKGRADIEGPLLKCISSIKSPNLKTTKNTATLKKMKAEIKRHLQGFVNRERTSEDTIQIYRFYLATLVKIVVSRKWSFEKISTGWSRSDNSTQNSSGVICLGRLNSADIARLSTIYSDHSIILTSLQSRNVLDKKGWSNSEVDLFWKEYTPEVISAISLGLESSAILRFIKFVEKET